MTRPAVIFDFGNVLAFFDYGRACASLGAPHGIAGDALLDRLRNSGLPDLIREYESGRIATTAFTAEASRRSEPPITPEQFARAWVDIFWLNEPIAAVVRALKRQGYPLVLGSNTNALHADHFRRQFAEILRDFDAIVLSYEVGAMKPSPIFYRACAEAAGRPPRDCLFIDDLAENVEGARAAGLQAIHFQDVPSLVLALRDSGIEFGGDDFARLADTGHVD